MAASTPKFTLLQVNGSERPIFSDKKATVGTIKPGHILKLASATTIAPVTTADAIVEPIIAVEAGWANTDTTKTVQDDPYDTGDTVNYIYAQQGDLVYLWLSDGQTTAIGSLLATHTTAGEVVVETTNTDRRVFAMATEVVAASGAAARVRARII
jgi:hypothetical protein